jgi:hypothetical protein
MVMRTTTMGLRTSILLLGLPLGYAGFSQASGFNLTLQYAHAIVDGDKGLVPSATLGIGFQHDLQQRLGMGVDLNYAGRDGGDVSAFEFIYSAKYFLSDNDATACYIGSFIGVQSFSGTDAYSAGGSSASSDISRLQFPVGLRAGVRGGLDGYFGELFTHVGYAIGNGELVSTSSGKLNSEALYFGLGFSFLGFGWE